MEVKKIAKFTNEEVDFLVKAGEVLGGLAKAISAGEVDGLDDNATNLVKALKEVIERI